MADSGTEMPKGITALLPDNTLPLGYVVILPFIDLEGDKSWLYLIGGELETIEAVGYIEATKAQVLDRIGCES